MEPYDPGLYRFSAAHYDDVYDAIEDTDAAVETVLGLARGGAILELGIGTGRLALPIAARGAEVHGIDASPEMVERLRAKPGGAAIPVTIGDFVETRIDGQFAVVLVAFNTFFAPLSQQAQVRAFRNAASQLAQDGVVVIEAFVPDPTRHRNAIYPRLVRSDRVELQIFRCWPQEQRLDTTLVRLTPTGLQFFPFNWRYATPAELDLMAQLAGCELLERWGGWSRQPFTDASAKHVSVYARSSSSV
jgi:SAM-dependent methyltransferase